MSNENFQNLINYVNKHDPEVLDEAYKIVSERSGWDLADAVDEIDSSLYDDFCNSID